MDAPYVCNTAAVVCPTVQPMLNLVVHAALPSRLAGQLLDWVSFYDDHQVGGKLITNLMG